MRRKKPYGRAYKISASDAKAYKRTDRPRVMRANPIGVTSMAAVNGRGSYRKSARAASLGKTRSEREKRAREVLRNGDTMPKRAGFLKNKKRVKKNAKRGTARSVTPNRRKRPAKKRVGLHTARTRAASRRTKSSTKRAKRDSKGRFLKKNSVSRKRSAASSRIAAERRERAAAAAAAAPAAKPKKKRKPVSRAVKAARARRKRIVGAPKASARTYKRIYMIDPETGRRRLSYMYKQGRKRRKIPAKALTSSGYTTAEKIAKARKRAADRVLKRGSAFVANKKRRKKSSKSTGAKRRGRRLAAFNAARKSGKTVKAAKSAALKKVPLVGEETFMGVSSGSGTGKRSKKRRKTSKRRRKAGAKRKTTRRTKKRAGTKRRKAGSKRRKTTKRRKAGSKRRKTTKRRKAGSKKRRSTTKRRRSGSKRRRSSAKRKSSAAPKRRRSSKRRRSGFKRNGRRSYRRNGFMEQLKSVLKTGLLVAAGFLTHRVATSFASSLLDAPLANVPALQAWKRPIAGLVILGVGVPVLGKVLPKQATEISAGMAASFFQSLIVSALTVANQPTLAGHLSGYSNSRAYQLRGRGLHGPAERNAQSIMPQYAPISGFEQAAAGFEQAAAGFGAGMGEYFAPNGTGEYFAPNGIQGVGSYEAAGSLALQAAAGSGDIDDGIRPDSDIDGIMDLAEAAAGLRGMGEFYAAVQASGGRVEEKRVGTKSTWVPAGPLWAGALPANDSQDTSELSAGILVRPGDNGILSAG